MKTNSILLAVSMVALLCGCGLYKGGPEATMYLPQDQVRDVTRAAQTAADGQFDFKTYLPLGLSLKVVGYDLRPVEVARAAGTAVPSAELSQTAPNGVAILTTEDKRTIYIGPISSEKPLQIRTAVPASVDRALLTVSAEGYETRSIEIANLADLATIDRTLALGQTQGSTTTGHLPDTDNDGIPDQYDAFPTDGSRSFAITYPPDGAFTIAFEDLYPVPGDSDFNDFVAYYEVVEISDGAGLVKLGGVVMAGARAAGYDHEFGIRVTWQGDYDASYAIESGPALPGHGPWRVVTGRVSDSGDGRREARLVIFPRTKQAFSRPGGVTVDNGWPDKQDSVGYIAGFVIEFDTPIPLNLRPEPPYDPYLLVHNTGHDIHLIDKEPLDPADRYNPRLPPHFRDPSSGFPWALLVPSDWEHPIETHDIHGAYPRFESWYTSGGLRDGDWYSSEVVGTEIVPLPDGLPDWVTGP